jgi:alpha-galactosidase
MLRRLLALLVVLVGVFLSPASSVVRGDEPLIQSETAFVWAVDDGRGWVIGNEFIRYGLELDGQAVGVSQILDPESGFDWLRSNGPDSFVKVDGTRVLIGSGATVFARAAVSQWWGGVRLDLTFRLQSAPIEITRTYACYPGSPVIEMWTTFQSLGSRPATLADLTDYALSVPNGTLHWLTGAQTAAENGGPFTIGSGDLDDGQIFPLGADRRSSEQAVPYFGIDANNQHFFGAVLWSGSWRFQAQRFGDTMALEVGMQPFSTTLGGGASLEMPHAILGFTTRALPEVAMAARGFIDKGLRHGRPFASYVTYNTWYSYGTFVDEPSMIAEMDMAAAMGVEQFVVDAGWWFHINSDDAGDFSRGWGTWEVDPERFPSGLGLLTDHAHELGMRFGVWTEPEKVDRATIGQPGLVQERFLATVGTGKTVRYDPSLPNSQSTTAQICLADPAARAWLLGKLINFLDEVHPDYLKWDNNFWVNCTRTGHTHGPEDGNFAHIRGLQQVREALRNRYPALDIESSSSGANRLSLDSMIYTDATWMDDRTSPSTRVRHDFSGLGVIFPSAFLMSFAVTTEAEPIAAELDLSNVLRSRMLGNFGSSWIAAEMSEATRLAAAKEIALYKRFRPIAAEGSLISLTPQFVEFPDAVWSGWDLFERLLPRTGEAVVFAFDSPDAPEGVVVKPKGLRSTALYDVESADFGLLGTVSGEDLMTMGIEVRASGISHSHVLILRLHVDP